MTQQLELETGKGAGKASSARMGAALVLAVLGLMVLLSACGGQLASVYTQNLWTQDPQTPWLQPEPMPATKPEQARSILPSHPWVLLTIKQWGNTNLSVLDGHDFTVWNSLGPKPLGDVQKAQNASRVAYLASVGTDPARNYLEVVDLASGATWRVHPAQGFAISGFTLSPDGSELAYGEVGLMGGSSRLSSWRVLVANFKEGKTRLVLTSASTGVPPRTQLLPSFWSAATGDIYLAGQTPFGGKGQGTWALKPDGTGLRTLLPETDYVGTPVFSPDGARVAYASLDIANLPQNYQLHPGAPPGNILNTKDLASGSTTSFHLSSIQAFVAAKTLSPGAAFQAGTGQVLGTVAWSGQKGEVLASVRTWQTDRFLDSRIIAIGSDGVQRNLSTLSGLDQVVSIVDCGADGSTLWASQGAGRASITLKKGNDAPKEVFNRQEAQVRLVSCQDE